MIKMRDREGQLQRRMKYFKFENNFKDSGLSPQRLYQYINNKAVRETLLYELLNDEEVLAFDHLIGNDTEI